MHIATDCDDQRMKNWAIRNRVNRVPTYSCLRRSLRKGVECGIHPWAPSYRILGADRGRCRWECRENTAEMCVSENWILLDLRSIW
eukprot:jgi/Mesvir1/19404/Mv25212-RA.1